jgi:hypothetical protein
MPAVGDGFRKSRTDRAPVFIVIDQQRGVKGIFATWFRNSETAAAQQRRRSARPDRQIRCRHHHTMFTALPDATLEWNDAALEGSYRFLRRVW